MPIYEYICKSCHHTFEDLIRTAADEAGIRCPACGNMDVGKLISVAGFQGDLKQGSASSEGAGCSSCVSGNCTTCR